MMYSYEYRITYGTCPNISYPQLLVGENNLSLIVPFPQTLRNVEKRNDLIFQVCRRDTQSHSVAPALGVG